MDVERHRAQVEGTLSAFLDASLEAPQESVDPGLSSATICALSWYADNRRRIVPVERQKALATPIPEGPIQDHVRGEGAICLLLDRPIAREVGCLFVSSWKSGRVLPYPEPWWSRDPDGHSVTEYRGMLRAVSNFIQEGPEELSLRFIDVVMGESMGDLYKRAQDNVQRSFFRLLAYAIQEI